MTTIKTKPMKVCVSEGNVKVACPIINMGSASECPSRAWCPFSAQNYKASGKPCCYAMKAERIYPTALNARRTNALLIQKAIEDGKVGELAAEVAFKVAKLAKKMGTEYVRYNEAGDLSTGNVSFAVALTDALTAMGLKPYTYSKAPKAVINKVREAGAVIMESETDFVCVKNEAEAKEKGLDVCPGEGCGKSCERCCKGLRTAVIAH
jgi:hypothetical protein